MPTRTNQIQLSDSRDNFSGGSRAPLPMRLRRWIRIADQPVRDESTESLSRYRYDMWGVPTKTNGAQDADFQYAGYYAHARSGLNLTVYRGYMPTSGRWINRDPIEEDGGANLYGYVGNMPTFFTDPSGLLGLGVQYGGNVGAGFPGVTGGAGQIGGGIGAFGGGGQPFSTGTYTQGGWFAGTPCHMTGNPKSQKKSWVVGLDGGAGIGLFLTNANSVGQLGGNFNNYNISFGLGPGVSANLATGGGVWQAGFQVGGGVGGAITSMTTNTW